MPEGDTIHNAARRVGAALVGREIVSVETPQPRHGQDAWPRRLAGRAVLRVDAHGKHLFVRFSGGLTLHSHLRMHGWWGVYPRGRRWGRSPRRAWLVLRTADHDVVQFDGPVLELMTEGRTRFDQVLSGLGPDILAAEWDEPTFLARVREDDPTRGVGDALLDQRNVAGLGNIWKSEGCFLGRRGPVAAPRRRDRRRAARDRARDAPPHARLGRPRPGRHGRARPAHASRREAHMGLRTRGHALPALRHPRPLPRPGRRQPHDVLVPPLPGLSLRRGSGAGRPVASPP